MKILFVNPHFKIGGIATSLYNLIGELKENKELQVEVVSLNPYFDEKFKDLKSWVNVKSPFLLKFLFISTNEANKHLSYFQLPIYYLVKSFAKLFGINRSREIAAKWSSLNFNEEYDVAISFCNDIPLTGANFGGNDFVEYAVKADKKVAFIHNDLDKLGITREYILDRYNVFNTVVNVSKTCKETFESLVPEFKQKSYLVHNFIDPMIVWDKGNREFNNPFKEFETKLITVARLDNTQKRIDRIVAIASRLKEEGISFSWYILGSGQDLELLKKMAKDQGVDDKLVFLGFVQNPYPYIKAADCFVLTSDYEAQGMVLSEALILETPVITTNFPAANEFVVDGENGFIVEKSVDKIYEKLKEVIGDSSIIEAFGRHTGMEKSLAAAEQAKEEFYTLINH